MHLLFCSCLCPFILCLSLCFIVHCFSLFYGLLPEINHDDDDDGGGRLMLIFGDSNLPMTHCFI